MQVAPLVGAWIETALSQYGKRESYVAPLVGAWIETAKQNSQMAENLVAPLVGAWIETLCKVLKVIILCSRTPRGCVD